MSNTRKILVIAVLLVVAAVLSFGIWWFFIRDDAPEAANIEDAGRTLDEAGDDGSSGDGEDVEGEWTIDPTIGSFEDFSGTWAGYRIEEELASIGGNTAAGRTPDVTGSLTIADDEVTEASFEVDMTTLQSDESLRDNALRGRGLETDTFPTASFRLTEPLALPDDATSGETIHFEATGELTLHGVTKTVTIPLDAQLDGNHIAVVGSAPVVLADYQIEPPEGFSVVSVADQGTFEFQLFLGKE